MGTALSDHEGEEQSRRHPDPTQDQARGTKIELLANQANRDRAQNAAQVRQESEHAQELGGVVVRGQVGCQGEHCSRTQPVAKSDYETDKGERSERLGQG